MPPSLRRSEHCSSSTRQSRLLMRLSSIRMRPSLRGRGSWGLQPACSPSGRWTSWPNSVTCPLQRPEHCSASTLTRSVVGDGAEFLVPRTWCLLHCSGARLLKNVDGDYSCRWCLCARRNASSSLPWLSWKCSWTSSRGWCSGWKTPWIARSSTRTVGSPSSRRSMKGACSSYCSSAEVQMNTPHLHSSCLICF